jgi:hypothetical protein
VNVALSGDGWRLLLARSGLFKLGVNVLNGDVDGDIGGRVNDRVVVGAAGELDQITHAGLLRLAGCWNTDGVVACHDEIPFGVGPPPPAAFRAWTVAGGFDDGTVLLVPADDRAVFGVVQIADDFLRGRHGTRTERVPHNTGDLVYWQGFR